MRLPIAIGAILVASVSFNAPVMSATPTQGVQTEIATSKLRQLTINRQLWNRQKINNYRYQLSNDCFCISEFRGPLIIEVRNGRTTSITNANTGKPLNSELLRELRQYSTIPKLFNLIQNAINRGESELTVGYNPRLGYPTQINIGNLAADAGIFTRISNFEILQKR
ncbi:DUF6174 domain-containing protein [Nostoc sp. CHAB 5836]|uniref:DUF6174 domain-containing protein n=1 Tax=Nostoc sp. CHAB 5836 TaxID=2780404 RepID=UPI001E4F8A46|nr:DUF6174 domain-containing protein [Nostoc sp. CHAB 5836]MCC5615214.1 DUF6174 domain-containing protein [Nostoc sp. CHAB 5836]